MFAAVVLSAPALSGCVIGEEQEQAKPYIGDWFSDNCVPVECLRECCQGWNYSQKALLHGGQVLADQCAKIRANNPAYAEYDYLTLLPENYCSGDYAYFESGYCEVINPPDVIKEFSDDGRPVYAGLNFSVCAPKGQKAAHPAEAAELIPEE